MYATRAPARPQSTVSARLTTVVFSVVDVFLAHGLQSMPNLKRGAGYEEAVTYIEKHHGAYTNLELAARLAKRQVDGFFPWTTV